MEPTVELTAEDTRCNGPDDAVTAGRKAGTRPYGRGELGADMKIYVAAKFEAKDAVKEIYARLRDAGHVITHDWTQEDDTAYVTFAEKVEYHRMCAMNDLEGVRSADALVLFPHEKGKGLYFEFGAAMALDIPVFILGQWYVSAPCIFQRLVSPKRWLSNVEELVEALIKVQEVV